MKISFHSYANKTYFHLKGFAPSLDFVMRFKATWKWLIAQPDELTLLAIRSDERRKSRERAQLANAGEFNR